MLRTMKNIKIAIRLLLAFSLLTGVCYPLLVTCFARIFFPDKSDGSLIVRNGVVIGSELIAQKVTSPKYFAPRPSAGDFQTIPSGSSNFSITSEALRSAVSERRSKLGQNVPIDLLTTSGSGLDPDISPAGANFQVERILAARGLAAENKNKIVELIRQNTEDPQWGFLGSSRVNVVKVNLSLDKQFP